MAKVAVDAAQSADRRAVASIELAELAEQAAAASARPAEQAQAAAADASALATKLREGLALDRTVEATKAAALHARDAYHDAEDQAASKNGLGPR
jgi:hypothetical protein